ncbi:opioid-binding protein/cell adhesion molecule homolog isoform X3 [Biomphalaria glabrata]|nr:opioid-binding protein/cell adhesion molecule homolog isoform X3 [Biomphalaria glabrata]
MSLIQRTAMFTWCQLTAFCVTLYISIVKTTVPVLPSHEPKFDMPMVNVTVKERNTAVLPCSVSSLGSYQVVWTDQVSTLLTFEDRRIIDDERLSVERPYTRDWNLHIRDVRYSDQGIYNCQINTSPVKIKTINLIVQVPSKILDHLSSTDVVVREGETVTLVCNVTGTPQPTVTWYRLSSSSKGSEKQSELCPGSDKVGVNGEVLVIHNVTRFCGDSYECVAYNNVAPPANKLIKVYVEFAPEIYLPNKRIGQERGKETILECTVTAFPHAVSMWQKDGIKLTTSPKYRVEAYDEEKNKLTLSLRVFNIQDSDFGAYKCIAENPLGSDEEIMYLYDYAEQYKSSSTTPITPSTTLNPYEPHVHGQEETHHVYVKSTASHEHKLSMNKPGAWSGAKDPGQPRIGIVVNEKRRNTASTYRVQRLFVGMTLIVYFIVMILL